MSKAEERALEAYPVENKYYTETMYVPTSRDDGIEYDVRKVEDTNLESRKKFIEGYEAAEKDLALTWKDIMIICEHYVNVNYEYDYHSIQEKYEEILRRFKEAKK